MHTFTWWWKHSTKAKSTAILVSPKPSSSVIRKAGIDDVTYAQIGDCAPKKKIRRFFEIENRQKARRQIEDIMTVSRCSYLLGLSGDEDEDLNERTNYVVL